jgi:hypothetical protein
MKYFDLQCVLRTASVLIIVIGQYYDVCLQLGENSKAMGIHEEPMKSWDDAGFKDMLLINTHELNTYFA